MQHLNFVGKPVLLQWLRKVDLHSVIVTGSTRSTLLHGKIKPNFLKIDRYCLFGDAGLLQSFRVVSSDFGKPRVKIWDSPKLSWKFL